MLDQEFDRQIDNLIRKGYPERAGLRREDFPKRLEPLRQHLSSVKLDRAEHVQDEGYAPFIIVMGSGQIDGETAMQLVERNGKTGLSIMDREEIQRFQPIEGIELPNGMAYIAVHIDTGKDTLNVTPNEAMTTILDRNRSPLTIEEGIALITHFPEIIRKNHGFSLLGSRSGDRRVTALWISEGKPKLGWCWAGNPHTWLGSASCGYRLGS